MEKRDQNVQRPKAREPRKDYGGIVMLETVGICVGCLLMPSPIYRPPNKPMLVGRIPSRSHQHKDNGSVTWCCAAAPNMGRQHFTWTAVQMLGRGKPSTCWRWAIFERQPICCVGMGMDFVPVSIAVIFISWGLPKAELNWGFPAPQSIKCMAMR